VSIETEQGAVRRTVSLSEPVTRRWFTLDDRPLALHVDPDFDVFRRLHRTEVAPTLGQALGTASILIVVPSQGEPALVQAYNQLASQWAGDQRYTVVGANQVASDLSQNTTV
jgi:aminopeptidase N